MCIYIYIILFFLIIKKLILLFTKNAYIDKKKKVAFIILPFLFKKNAVVLNFE